MRKVSLFSGLFLAFMACVFFVFPDSALAQIVYPTCIENGNCYTCDLIDLFVSIANFVLTIVSGIVLFVIAFGGFMWIYAAGNDEKVKKGTSMIFGAVTGLVFVLCGWLLVNVAMAAILGQDPRSVRLFSTDWAEVCREGSTLETVDILTTCSTDDVGQPCTGGLCTSESCVCLAARCVDACTYIRSEQPAERTATCVADATACEALPGSQPAPNPTGSCSSASGLYCCVYNTSIQ